MTVLSKNSIILSDNPIVHWASATSSDSAITCISCSSSFLQWNQGKMKRAWKDKLKSQHKILGSVGILFYFWHQIPVFQLTVLGHLDLALLQFPRASTVGKTHPSHPSSDNFVQILRKITKEENFSTKKTDRRPQFFVCMQEESRITHRSYTDTQYVNHKTAAY